MRSASTCGSLGCVVCVVLHRFGAPTSLALRPTTSARLVPRFAAVFRLCVCGVQTQNDSLSFFFNDDVLVAWKFSKRSTGGMVGCSEDAALGVGISEPWVVTPARYESVKLPHIPLAAHNKRHKDPRLLGMIVLDRCALSLRELTGRHGGHCPAVRHCSRQTKFTNGAIVAVKGRPLTSTEYTSSQVIAGCQHWSKKTACHRLDGGVNSESDSTGANTPVHHPIQTIIHTRHWLLRK